MELTFNKVGNAYVAEFQATADFNLHLEKAEGVVGIAQRTSSEGEFAQVASFPYHQQIIDVDFIGTIYPKTIKVTSAVNPTKAVITL